MLDESDYYVHAKNYWQSISLGGDRVNSFGEKCIADFLFEHGLAYKYEYEYTVFQDERKSYYKPDFTIYDSDSGKTFILEHWAIPDKYNYTDRKIWDRSNKTERQYADEREVKRNYWKKDYWKKRQHLLIETDISWLSKGRDSFEFKLKNLFEANNIRCIKLSEQQLLEKVYRKHSNKLFKLFVSFIQKCRKNGYTPESIKERRDKYQTDNEKEDVFLRVAPEIYEKYENSLIDKNELDFDSLINNAVESILESHGECEIYDRKNNVSIKVKDLKFILIDEFQDFSKQFHDVISAIREVNPGVRLFCVGDDWQAINGFAGSDLQYFYEFNNNYLGAGKKHILVNYRSGRKIVSSSNNLMDGNGEKSQFSQFNLGGTVKTINIEDFDIEARNNQNETQQFSDDNKYVQACEIKIRKKDGGEWVLQDYNTARYLKAVHMMILENVQSMSQKDKRCFVLTRGNRFGCFRSSNSLKDKILEVFSEEEMGNFGGEERLREKIHVMTAHISKGKEADIVFVLKCNERIFPMIHPDNRLFGIFGITDETVLEEERRLFYVALTRAKNKVFLLTEEENRSPFLDEI